MSKFTNNREACEQYAEGLDSLFIVAWHKFGEPKTEDDYPTMQSVWSEEDGVLGWRWALSEDKQSCLYTIGAPGLDPGFDLYCPEAERLWKAVIQSDVEIAAAAVATVLNPKATWEHDTELIHDYLWDWIASKVYRKG